MAIVRSDGQRRVASVAADGRLHEGREAGLGAVLHDGLLVEQEGDHLVLALEAGQGLRHVAVGLYLDVDVGGHVEQQLHRGGVAVYGGKHEGRCRAWSRSRS